MAVSVIVSNFNGARYLPRLLETLKSQRNAELEIIVVDRNSTDGSNTILAAHDVHVIQEAPERGLVAGYAAGTALAQHEHLFFINEDMWFDADCIARLEAKLDIPRRIWAADPWQWTYDGKQWIHGGTRFARSRNFVPIAPHPYRQFDFTVPLRDGDIIPFGCAGAVLVDRQVYERVGGWDTSFFLDREDIDLFLRAWRLGWQCVVVPEAKVYHAVGASNVQTLEAGKIPVSKRRYISSCSSQLVISVKHFPARWVAMHFATYVSYVAYHLLAFRVTQAWWEMLALRELWTRLPAALAFRWRSRRAIAERPGQKFFTEPAFQRDAA